ncbi:hypothetical protein BDY21DRAFT_390454 [Lineolata rhizophorae]|uniref:HAD-like domain-containing protein n=1 Tax=Lineolata rhizophorae TaxID=578093 RepID=A0A6A6P1R4_9PEZI|nr:hypothetical protein BDY21DRAFT_390454 [Lineolata rhizophorae]
MTGAVAGPQKRCLLLGLDAFGTLFTPRRPVLQVYAEVARQHGITGFRDEQLPALFRKAMKEESRIHPNYGKSVGMNAEAWWSNVITSTFRPFTTPSVPVVPAPLCHDLMTRFSSAAGYKPYPDVLPFFASLRAMRAEAALHPAAAGSVAATPTARRLGWRWDRTVVGVVTNSDDRVPSILASLGVSVAGRRAGAAGASPAAAPGRRQCDGGAGEDVEFVVLSYDVGFEKPDREIFDAATHMLAETLASSSSSSSRTAQEYDVADFEKLYVGDELKKDVLGAKDAGWNAILLDRGNCFRDCLVEDCSVESVDAGRIDKDFEGEMVSVVEGLGALRTWHPKVHP